MDVNDTENQLSLLLHFWFPVAILLVRLQVVQKYGIHSVVPIVEASSGSTNSIATGNQKCSSNDS